MAARAAPAARVRGRRLSDQPEPRRDRGRPLLPVARGACPLRSTSPSSSSPPTSPSPRCSACADAGAKAVVLAAQGFSEQGDEGREREEALTLLARERGIRLDRPEHRRRGRLRNRRRRLDPAAPRRGHPGWAGRRRGAERRHRRVDPAAAEDRRARLPICDLDGQRGRPRARGLRLVRRPGSRRRDRPLLRRDDQKAARLPQRRRAGGEPREADRVDQGGSLGAGRTPDGRAHGRSRRRRRPVRGVLPCRRRVARRRAERARRAREALPRLRRTALPGSRCDLGLGRRGEHRRRQGRGHGARRPGRLPAGGGRAQPGPHVRRRLQPLRPDRRDRDATGARRRGVRDPGPRARRSRRWSTRAST